MFFVEGWFRLIGVGVKVTEQNRCHLYTTFPKLDRIFNVINEIKYVELQNRDLQMIGSIEAALQEADYIILAIWFDFINEFLILYASQLEGKIIVDLPN